MAFIFSSLSRTRPSRPSDDFDTDDVDLEEMYKSFDEDKNADLSGQPQLASRLFDEYERRYVSAAQARHSL